MRLLAALSPQLSTLIKFGAHMCASGGVWKTLQRARSIRCEIVQISLKNNIEAPGVYTLLAKFRSELPYKWFLVMVVS